MRILIMSDKRLRRFLLTNKILRFSYFLAFSLKTIPCSTVLLVAIRHGRVCAELSFGERMRETLCMHSSSTVLLFLKKVWSKNQYIIHSISSMCLLFWRRHLHSSFSTLFCYALIEMLKRVLMSHWTIEAFFLLICCEHTSWLSNSCLLLHHCPQFSVRQKKAELHDLALKLTNLWIFMNWG